MLRFALLPFALVCFALFAMSVEITTTTLHHRMAWPETTVVVLDAGMAPTGNLKYGKPIDLAVKISYRIDGDEHRWTGFGKDIGIYKAEIGEKISLHYNPADPADLDRAEMKGWRGGLLVIFVTGGLVALYVWFFWLRGGRPPASPPARSTQPRARSFGLR